MIACLHEIPPKKKNKTRRSQRVRGWYYEPPSPPRCRSGVNSPHLPACGFPAPGDPRYIAHIRETPSTDAANSIPCSDEIYETSSSTHKGIPQEGGVFSNWGKMRNKGLLLTAVACLPQRGIPTQPWCYPKFIELSMFQMQQV
jgi:hypothetical protein